METTILSRDYIDRDSEKEDGNYYKMIGHILGL